MTHQDMRVQGGQRAGWVMACLLNMWAPRASPSTSRPREAVPPVPSEGLAVLAERDAGTAVCPSFDDVSLMYSAMRTVAASITASHPQLDASARVLSLAHIVREGSCAPLRWGHVCTAQVMLHV